MNSFARGGKIGYHRMYHPSLRLRRLFNMFQVRSMQNCTSVHHSIQRARMVGHKVWSMLATFSTTRHIFRERLDLSDRISYLNVHSSSGHNVRDIRTQRTTAVLCLDIKGSQSNVQQLGLSLVGFRQKKWPQTNDDGRIRPSWFSWR